MGHADAKANSKQGSDIATAEHLGARVAQQAAACRAGLAALTV